MPPETSNPAAQFAQVRARIDAAAAAASLPLRPRLVAVSKTRPAADIRALAALGQRAFGENYVQEALAKQAELSDLALEWHLIGHLQSNKCREAAQHFDWVQSVDRIKLVRELGRHRPPQRDALNLLIQVNIDDEGSKSGCAPDAIDALADAIVAEPRLALRGLMAIPDPDRPEPERRTSLRRLRTLFERLQARLPGVDTLSMGMSDDFELAIAAGATLVRIGTALFGPRSASA